MTKREAQERLEKLKTQITNLRFAYHVENAPSVTDDVYESLIREAKKIEAQYPDLSVTESFDRVAGVALDAFVKVTHRNRMLSLNDVFSLDELRTWSVRMEKLLNGAPHHYFAEIKLDGLAVSLQYEKGVLIQAATRGDGFVGEDVTENAKVVQTIPLTLSKPLTITVRGEIIMRKAVLAKLNKKQAAAGKQLFANTRNAAAGSIRQLDPSIAKERDLDFFAYDISDIEGVLPATHSEKHALLHKLGFPVVQEDMRARTVDELVPFIASVADTREKLSYNIDGIVIAVDEISLQEELGVVGKAPRYAVAYKYPAERATTMVTDITVQVGRTGVLTPLAHFIPTLVAGSTVSKATLHNIDQINRLDIRIGDTVVIQKAGDVIPEVVQVLRELRTGTDKKFTMPKRCPVCDTPVSTRESQTKGESVAYYCTNDDCPARNTRGIIHFVKVLDIYEVGPKLIEKLQEEGFISDAADLFMLDPADLAGLERLGEKSATNIVEAVAAKKHPTLDRFIASLGIMHVGEETARDIALTFGTFEKFWGAKPESFDAIPNIGPAVIESIITWRNKTSSKHFIDKLFAAGVAPQTMKKIDVGKFTGKIFVLTGTLPTLDRNEAKQLIQAAGGKVASTVSKNTSYVVAGENPGSKYDDAKKLSIPIIEEKDFLDLIKTDIF